MPNKPILPQHVLEQRTLSRYERERRTRKYVVIGSIVVAFLVLLLVVAAALQILVFEPNRAVAAVDGETITVQQVQARERLEWEDLAYNYSQLAQQVQQLQQANDENSSFLVQFYQQQLQQVIANASVDQVSRNALDALIDDLLIRQETKRRGIVVSPEDVQREIETSLGYYSPTLTPFPTYTPFTPEPTATAISVTAPLTAPTPLTTSAELTPTPTAGPLPTATPRLQPTSITQAELESKRESGAAFYSSLGYQSQQFDSAYESSLLAKKLQDAFATEVPTKTQHYKFDYVRFNSVTTATEYAQLLASGQITFEAMITQVNAITQPESIGLGAQRDWTSQASVESQFGTEILAALEGQPLNQPTSVISSQLTSSFYIVLPLGREVRELDEADLSQAQSKAYSDWLTAAKADADRVQRMIDPATVMPNDLKTSIQDFQNNVGTAGTTQ